MTTRFPFRTAARIASRPLALGLLAVLLLARPAAGDRVRNVQAGQPVPPFSVRTIDGEDLSSAALRGKVVALVYVSADQRSSERALAALGALGRELRHPDLAIVSMTADTVRVGDFRQQRSRLDFTAPLGLDVGRQVYGSLGIIVLPTTVIIDREGRLAHVISSYKGDHEHVLRSYVRHALGLIDAEELEAALTKKQYERDRPEDRIARHRAAADLLRDKGLLDDAETELRSALAIDATHAETRLDLAALHIAQGRVDDAAAIVESVIATEPYPRRAKLLHGIVLYHANRFAEAEGVLEETLLLNPDPARTHYYLGLVAEKRGDQAAAIVHFKEALRRVLE